MTRVAVVGGGVSGLVAAHRLRRSLGPDAEIVLVEQTGALGGKLRSLPLAGVELDLGAEAFLARRPEVLRLAEELGLAADVVHPGPVAARVRAGGALHPLPAGTVMGVPADPESVAGVLSPAGVAAVRAEADLPPLELGGADASVGGLLRARVGDEVVDRLVEPLLGGVYAGSADGLGLRATIPALAAALDAGAKSITEAAAAALPAPAPDGRKRPVFGAFRHGYREFVAALADSAAAEVRLGAPVRALHRDGAGWRLEIGSAPAPDVLAADAVVLAVPAPAARKLLAGASPAAAELLGRVEVASMAVFGLALPTGTELPAASGTLVARGEVHADGTPFTAKAFTFTSRKWPHLTGTGGEPLVRGSVGRTGQDELLRRTDAELLRGVLADLREVTGVDAEPVDAAVVRWGGGLPQYGVDHLDLVAGLERAVGELDGVELAGAALHGVGVPACAATGEAAATGITRHLATG
ncbi:MULTISPECIES: protoporphyrinogen oxidase [unclassified Saccharopolyspora]|uniref:protoporphyrinogen oxidase n=1 Tax=unclassified Saccharopolyspora TaxID=2646250 RepID=UPI001CD76B19|nr:MULTISPECIES: protoporphyrinogen oxidase [unclassified Saccharopolyspora]MCA1186121.1 protoporphyrinogen oxidase [Saccharopolyspora sp. 6T]MCA1224576.1 protoporphyrinogen oxidase [Saccharopolyspora sp. 6M]MCA1279047.1 protoporphyrinogen oxidase [Saccharopolyspora sp. 7B]